MREKTILLSGGRDLDVVPLEGADEFLISLLGEAPSTPAVPYLRSAKNVQGRECIGVFIGSQHVGYLSEDTDATLLATIQACELNGAVARARGNLIASWDCPGQVRVKVSLADSDHLFSAATSETPSPSAVAPALAASLEDEAAFGVSPGAASPGHSASAPLPAGHTEDYPDWPPLKPKTSAATEPLAPLASTPDTEEAGTSTPSTWMSGTSIPARSPQSGWLGSTGQSAQPSASTPMGTGGASALAEWTAAPGQNSSSQGQAEHRTGSGSPEEDIVSAWTSSPPRAQPVVPSKPASSSSGGSKTWILAALVVVVLLAAALLVWKLVFAA
jgi:hypothetical protein